MWNYPQYVHTTYSTRLSCGTLQLHKHVWPLDYIGNCVHVSNTYLQNLIFQFSESNPTCKIHKSLEGCYLFKL